MIALLLGVPGVGKSSVAEGVKGMVEYINYGDVFLSIAKKYYNIEDRDELRRKIPEDDYLKLHNEAVKFILSKKKPVLLDTHASIVTPLGFMPGFPFEILKMLPVSLVIIVEAPPEEVEKRRRKDTRKRGGGLEDDVALHQEINRIFAALYSSYKGAPLYIIENREGKLSEAQNRLREVIERWMEEL